MKSNEELIHDIQMHIGRELDQHGKVDVHSLIVLTALQRMNAADQEATTTPAPEEG